MGNLRTNFFLLSAQRVLWHPVTLGSDGNFQLTATWPATNTLSHWRSIWGPKCFCKMLSLSSVTNLKSFLLLTTMFKCRNKTSVLSVTTDGYLRKVTPGLTGKSCSSWALLWVYTQTALKAVCVIAGSICGNLLWGVIHLSLSEAC